MSRRTAAEPGAVPASTLVPRSTAAASTAAAPVGPAPVATAVVGGRHRGSSPKVRRRWTTGAALLAAVAATTVVLFGGGDPGKSGSPTDGAALPTTVSPTAGLTETTAPSTTGATSVTATPTLQVPVDAPSTGPSAGTPAQLIVGKIGVNTSLYPLHLLADGSLQAPPKWQQAGWFAGGVRPGDTGPAVIAGHVDSYLGPAVFYRLTKLAVGDDVAVVSSTGRTLHFTVTRRQEFLKAAFPTDEVYGPTPLPELKLITCTGDFDRSKHSYVDNLIVTAVLDATRPS